MLIQNGTVRDTEYISSATPLNQSIQINDADMTSLANASYVSVYWFIDCEYIGQSEQWNASNFFKKENSTHNIEVLLVGSFEPRPRPQPTTTTTTTTTTTSTTTTTTTTTTSTTPSTTTSTSTTTTTTPKPSKRKRRDAPRDQYANETVNELVQNGELDPKDIINGTFVPSFSTHSPTTLAPFIDQPYVCFNKSNVAPDPKKIYGYFTRSVTVRSMFSNFESILFQI